MTPEERARKLVSKIVRYVIASHHRDAQGRCQGFAFADVEWVDEITEAIVEEREACARIAHGANELDYGAGLYIATAIRARP